MTLGHRRSWGALGIAIALAWSGLTAACADTWLPPPLLDAGNQADDAATKDADPSPCRACMRAPNEPGPGCANEFLDCSLSIRCAQIFECAYGGGCILKPTTTESVECVRPCLTGLEEGPLVIYLSNLFSCIDAKCRDACVME
jgi:hypothetical protein